MSGQDRAMLGVRRMLEGSYDDDRAGVVIVSATPGGGQLGEAAMIAGVRIMTVLPIGTDPALIEDYAAAATVLFDTEGLPGAALAEWLDRLGAACLTSGGRRAVIEIAPEMIDMAVARAGIGEVTLLCEPQPVERIAAIRNATAVSNPRPSALLHDVGREAGAGRLRQLSEEVGRIARTLATLSADDMAAQPIDAADEPAEFPTAGADDRTKTVLDASKIRRSIRARRLREEFFDAELFGDPAWDMLLDLMAARLEHKRVAVSSLCIASAVPATTALRWIKRLTEDGVFVRTADPQDGRRVFIELSDSAAAAMTGYLHAAERRGDGFA